MPMNKRHIPARALKTGGIFLLALLALTPELALAAPDLFGTSINPGDKSVSELLKPLFGDLFGGTNQGGFAAAARVFNAACMTVGGVLAAYTIIFGTMATAHDGEMLGKKWSSAWVPIRTALGIGLVAPLGSGFCVAQMIMAWITLQGVGLADSLWTTYITAATSTQNLAPKVAMVKTKDLAKSVLFSLTCVEAGKKIVAGAPSILDQVYASRPFISGNGHNFGTQYARDICGSIDYSDIVAPAVSYIGTVAVGSTAQERQTAQSQLRAAHIAAAQEMETTLKPLAVTIANAATVGADSGVVTDMSLLEKAADAYQTRVATAAAGIFGNDQVLKQMSDSATADGWVLAGAWFMRAAQLQDLVNKAASAVPAANTPKNARSGSSYDADFDRYYDTLQGSLLNSTTQFGGQENELPPATGMMARLKKNLFHPVKSSLEDWKLDPNRHPMMALKDFGDKMMVTSEIMLVGGAAIVTAGGAVGGVLQKITGIDMIPLLTYISLIVIPLSLALLGFATAISVYFPLLPFFIFFGTAIGWLLLVAESIIAAPLVSVMKLAPGGDDLMGSSRPAYMLMLGLLLRPPLIVLGFICSLISVEYVLRLFNAVFFPVFFASMGESMIGLVTMIAAVAIYFGVMNTILHKIFGLTHIVPDQILRWIGGGGDNLGGTARELGESARSHSGQAIASVANNASTAVNTGQRMIDTNRQNKRDDDNRAGAQKSGETKEAQKHMGDLPKLQSAMNSASLAASSPDAGMPEKVKEAGVARELAQKTATIAGHMGAAGNKEEEDKYNGQSAAYAQKANDLDDSAIGSAQSEGSAVLSNPTATRAQVSTALGNATFARKLSADRGKPADAAALGALEVGLQQKLDNLPPDGGGGGGPPSETQV